MRIVILADNPLTAEGIRRELRHIPTFVVIGYIDSRTPCSAAIERSAPDLIAIDDMGGADGLLERIREARQAAPTAKLVLLTSSMDHQWLADAAAAGIDAAIAKTLQSAGLGALVRQVAAGNVFHAFAQLAEPGPPPAAELGLTERELEILLLVAAGDSNARIARNLWVSEQTVKFHLSNTYRKLGVRNRTEASHYAHVHRLVDLEAVRPPQAA